METLKLLAVELARMLWAIFGTAFVLVFASGVIASIADAADAGEALIGVVVALVLAPLAAGAITYVLLPSLRQLSVAWGAALDGGATGGWRTHYLTVASVEFVSATLVVVLGALRYRQGASAGEAHWAQQGALILVGGLVLGGGAALARVVAAYRAAPGKGKRDAKGPSARDLYRAEARSGRDEASRRALAFCVGLGLTLAMSVAALPGGTP